MKPVAEMNFDELVLELQKSVACLIKHTAIALKNNKVVKKPSHNNARDEMLPGCSGCKHIAHDQTLDTYPCRGCIRVRRTDLFDAGSTSPVA